MRRAAGFIAAAAVALAAGARSEELRTAVSMTVVSTAPAPGGVSPLGTNLGSVDYFSGALPFVDLMKNAGDFFSQDAASSSPWDTDLMDGIPVDADGYPSAGIPYAVPGSGRPAQGVITAVAPPMYPGRYALLYDGTGDFQFVASPVSVVSRAAGRWVVQVNASAGSTIFLKIVQSSASDRVRNVRLVETQYEGAYRTSPFQPQFLSLLRGMGVLRFMDWGRTNGSPLVSWSGRPTPEGFQGGGRGVAYEWMIDLANAAGADPWICVPHRADDDFIRRLAELAQARLAPGRRLYVEYSNELWNGIFPQTGWVQQQGCAAGLNNLQPYPGACGGGGGAPFWAGIKYQARRAGQIFDIFERAFPDKSRLVKVLAAQAGFAEVGDKLLAAYDDAAVNPLRMVRPDAYAIAPYFGGGLGDRVAADGSYASMTASQFLDLAETEVEDETRRWTRDNKAIAVRRGVRLIGYEGGQHFVGNGANQNNAALTNLLTSANRDPRMRQLYAKMFDAWYQESGGDLFAHFTFITPFNKYGSWGSLESQTQDASTAPKYLAVQDRLAVLGY